MKAKLDGNIHVFFVAVEFFLRSLGIFKFQVVFHLVTDDALETDDISSR